MGEHDGLTMDELIARVGNISPRGVRYYIQRGLLPRPVLRGPSTVYPAECVVRVRAIHRLQAAGLSLDEVARRLAGVDLDAIGRIAEGLPPEKPAPPAEPSPAPAPPARKPGGGLWVRWELVPGLELTMSEGADEATRALAEALRDEVARRRGVGYSPA